MSPGKPQQIFFKVVKIRLFCTRAAGFTERGLARVFSTTRIARPPSIQVPGTGERSGLYTGTRYRGVVCPLNKYQVQERGLARVFSTRRSKATLYTGTRYRGEVCPLNKYQVQERGLAGVFFTTRITRPLSIQVPGTGERSVL